MTELFDEVAKTPSGEEAAPASKWSPEAKDASALIGDVEVHAGVHAGTHADEPFGSASNPEQLTEPRSVAQAPAPTSSGLTSPPSTSVPTTLEPTTLEPTTPSPSPTPASQPTAPSTPRDLSPWSTGPNIEAPAKRPVDTRAVEASPSMPAIGWAGLCLIAALIGFSVGQQYGEPGKTSANDKMPRMMETPGHQFPALVMNEYTISDAVNTASKWVVAIDVEAPAESSINDHVLPQLSPLGPRIRKSIGAGVIVRSDGYILTSNHIVKAGSIMKVQLEDKRIFTARLVGDDPYTDLALIKIDTKNLPAAVMGDNRPVHPGEWAIAIGSPMRLDHSVSLGIISAVGRNIAGTASKVDLIQTDAAINPGNSGGPLLNIRGEVIGITTAIRHDAQNIGFAVPIAVAHDVADDLMQHGSVVRGFLGLHMQELDETMGAAVDTPLKDGVVITSVVDGGPAAQAGIQSGDVIQNVDGRQTKTCADLRHIIMTSKPGTKLRILYFRHGAVHSGVAELVSPPGRRAPQSQAQQ